MATKEQHLRRPDNKHILTQLVCFPSPAVLGTLVMITTFFFTVLTYIITLSQASRKLLSEMCKVPVTDTDFESLQP